MLFLSLALIPVGLLGVLQTQEVVRRNEEQAEARLADLTRSAARAEREAILWAIGAAHGVGEVVLTLGDTGAACAARMADFAAKQSSVRTAGFVGLDGIMTCTSQGGSLDVSESEEWRELMEDPRERVSFSANPSLSRSPVIISTVPVQDSGKLVGFSFISQPLWRLQVPEGDTVDAQFLTFNADGDILTEHGEDKDPTVLLPRHRSLASLAVDRETTFTAASRSGAQKVYSVSPIIDGTVYAIGIWSKQSATPGFLGMPIPIPVFPVLMWITSLVVAYVAVERLTLRHIRRLRSEMRQFARNRVLPSGGLPDMVVEMEEIFDTFRITSETVLRDEAELEKHIHEKNVLLKEVHHRVKNNLQLISSIMNMQLRQMKDSEARGALKQLQSRVLGLATIHRNLYKTQNLGAVRAGPLMEELVNQLANLATGDSGTRIETEFSETVLYPDQAVPLSLLTAEAVTNALKYVGTHGDDAAWIKVSLTEEPNGFATMRVENSKGPRLANGGPMPGTGLGSNLIRAFASQLGGELTIEDEEATYLCSCRFEVQSFQYDDEDD